ncbi:peroxidase 1-like [Curcuma longa]|uniref:peroxidase 1-like n=1 Tax=Curcuma longa TaxID=136217 RepID=UPI003D9DE8BB
MASRTLFVLFSTLAFGLVLSSVSRPAEAQGLTVNFYNKTCPSLELIVFSEVSDILNLVPSLAAPLLRLHFHDCFVRGCDASVLLNSTEGNVAEKDAAPNLSLRGFGVIDRVKAKVEKACPGVVSCADILALVARDAVVMSGGKFWPVPTGRRDGLVSSVNETDQLPQPTANITTLIAMFQSKGLSVKDLVVLSGAHTIGISHCSSISHRFYNFTGKGSLADVDPALDQKYLSKLRAICKPNDTVTFVEMDPGSFRTFDTSYYRGVSKRRGVFQSDQALLTHPLTKAYVLSHAGEASQGEFMADFGNSMINMANVGVLTGSAGEIRKKCSVIN